MPVPLRLAFRPGGLLKLRRQRVGTPRRQWQSRSLMLFAGTCTTDGLYRDIRRQDIPAPGTATFGAWPAQDAGHAGWRHLPGAVVELRQSLRVYFCESQQHISAPVLEHGESQRLPALPWALKRYFISRGAADERGSSCSGDFFSRAGERRECCRKRIQPLPRVRTNGTSFFFFLHPRTKCLGVLFRPVFLLASASRSK